MARLPPIRRLTKEDFPELANLLGPAVDKLFQPLNDHMAAVYAALGKGLTVSDNFAGEVKTIDMEPTFPVRFNTTVPSKAVGIVVLQAKDLATTPTLLQAAVFPEWEQIGQQVTLKACSGLLPSHRYRLTLLILSDSTGAPPKTTAPPSPGTKTDPYSAAPTNGEAWHAVSTFTNSWANFGSGKPSASYFRDAAGIVHLKGLVKSGTIGSAAFTLPAGYRPLEDQLFAAVCGGGSDVFGSLLVTSAGVVTPNTGSNAYFSLNVSFRAEQ
jgi:hypothetical protein